MLGFLFQMQARNKNLLEIKDGQAQYFNVTALLCEGKKAMNMVQVFDCVTHITSKIKLRQKKHYSKI